MTCVVGEWTWAIKSPKLMHNTEHTKPLLWKKAVPESEWALPLGVRQTPGFFANTSENKPAGAGGSRPIKGLSLSDQISTVLVNGLVEARQILRKHLLDLKFGSPFPYLEAFALFLSAQYMKHITTAVTGNTGLTFFRGFPLSLPSGDRHEASDESSAAAAAEGAASSTVVFGASSDGTAAG
jgi:hypothetical protein